MASTYTTNLGIEKIASGEQSGSWGDTTNVNFDMFDVAVSGITTLTIPATGSSGSPNLLPITDGAASTGRNAFIEFSDAGDLGGTAFVQLTPNDAEKIVYVRNSLSGAQAINIFQGTYNASNDYTIPAGADVVLKFNGGGAGATVTPVFVNLLVEELAATSVFGTTVTGTTVVGTTFTGLPTSSETVEGVIELATQAEVDAGTDAVRAVTSATLTSFSNFPTVPAASETVAGIVELATVAETNTGTDDTRAMTPVSVTGWTGSSALTTLGTIVTGVWQGTALTTLGTIVTGVWQGTAINQTYLTGQSGTNTGDQDKANIDALGINAAQVDGKSIIVLTQAAYDGLTPDANTIYFTT
jgi:hypothetical protein